VSTLEHRGIAYDTGTRYVAGHSSRPDWSLPLLRRHVASIRDELGCNAVTVFGSDVDRVAAAAEEAAAAGLDVWLQPRLPDAGPDEALQHLGGFAEAAERLRGADASVRLNVGCELSIFASGIIGGRGFARRAGRLRWAWPLLPVFDRRLDRLLGRLVACARERFGGELTYGAGSWETVDWSRFDAVGLNHYRDASNRRRYEATLRAAARHGKPVLVTEFGCCSYPGADDRGAEGDGVVRWSVPPIVKGHHPRDESVQARELVELIDVFAAAGVSGAFVFEFSEPEYPRDDDPRLDLDVASFGIVAVRRIDVAGGRRYRDEPKAAFTEVARRYRSISG
jgi:hypothetical protein